MNEVGLSPLHFRGIVFGPSGFAAEGREWLAALDRAGLAPSLEGARLGELDQNLGASDRALLQRCAARVPVPGSVVFHHMLIPHFTPDPTARRNVLSTVFETEGLPPGWAENAARADQVIVKTAWSRDVFAQAGVPRDKLVVVPPPVDPTGFDPARFAKPRGPRPFRWLSVFDWSLRKGHDVLLEAFAQTFAGAEAELVLKINPQGRLDRAQVAEHCERIAQRLSSTPPRVVVMDTILNGDQLAALYASADAFVLASRGEGWGRPVHEAMLMELPVVATAATALATLVRGEDVGFPVRARPRAVSTEAARETPTFAGQVWHEPDGVHLAARMREVFEDPEAARQRGEAGRRHVLQICDLDRIGRALKTLLGHSPAAAIRTS